MIEMQCVGDVCWLFVAAGRCWRVMVAVS